MSGPFGSCGHIGSRTIFFSAQVSFRQTSAPMLINYAGSRAKWARGPLDTEHLYCGQRSNCGSETPFHQQLDYLLWSMYYPLRREPLPTGVMLGQQIAFLFYLLGFIAWIRTQGSQLALCSRGRHVCSDHVVSVIPFWQWGSAVSGFCVVLGYYNARHPTHGIMKSSKGTKLSRKSLVYKSYWGYVEFWCTCMEKS